MKKIIAGCLSLLPFLTMHAQEMEVPQHRKKSENKEVREERIKQELALTQNQAIQWDEIHKTYQMKLRNLRKDDQLTEEERRNRMKVLRLELDDQVNGILTDEQKEKWQAIKAHHKRKNKQQRKGEILPSNY